MICWLPVGVGVVSGAAAEKEAGVFSTPQIRGRIQANAERSDWGGAAVEGIVRGAEYWAELSDDQLWRLMFGPHLTRSWMVWSDGHCPNCGESVPMYEWVIDARRRPWKVKCPRCGQIFPTNDFAEYYRSGLDEHGVFQPELADRSLLYNADHPDPDDPKHNWGVDDGEGYVEGEKRWRFIGAYLVYGQWKQLIVQGLNRLSAAYMATGDQIYAHKAAILLDRIADLYPEFDFASQGLVYETSGHNGYVSTWHDACEETRAVVMAYDRVFDALGDDEALVEFLSRKAAEHKLNNPKSSWADIQRNIETGILRDVLDNRHKIESNYPRTDMTMAVIKTVLGWPGNRDEVLGMIDAFVQRSTAVDGVTGEKGLANYSAFATQGLSAFLEEYARVDPDFLPDIYSRHPQLHDMYRFFIDTWCLNSYYPLSGDTGSFVRPQTTYRGVRFKPRRGGAGWSDSSPLAPSMFTHLWRMYELTGDADLVKVLHHGNGGSVEGLPHDLYCPDPEAFRRDVAAVIADEGALPRPPSVNKQQWHLAILRSGDGDNRRAMWLDYDSGGGHGHMDGMNLGLFAMGLDLLPDFGYPPVQYGGWGSAKANWYRSTAAHNTVVVDGANHGSAAGKTALWADGEAFHAIRATAPEMYGIDRYERTAAMVDISDDKFYVIDIFRVVGGSDHAKFATSHFGTIETQGLSLDDADEFGHGTQMRNFRAQFNAEPGWSVIWDIEDRYELLPPDAEAHLRYTDLTEDADACTCEAWVAPKGFGSTATAWVPRVMTNRRADGGDLASTFVSVIEPYRAQPPAREIRRLPLHRADGQAADLSHVAIEIALTDGRSDLIIAADRADLPAAETSKREQLVLTQPDWDVRCDAELCFVRKSPDGQIRRIALCHGRQLTVGDLRLQLKDTTDYIEFRFTDGTPEVVAGDDADLLPMGTE